MVTNGSEKSKNAGKSFEAHCDRIRALMSEMCDGCKGRVLLSMRGVIKDMEEEVEAEKKMTREFNHYLEVECAKGDDEPDVSFEEFMAEEDAKAAAAAGSVSGA